MAQPSDVRQGTDRRERILEAGLAAFSSVAYDQVLVSAVAAEAGVAAGLPFHYFGSKKGLYIEVLRYISRQLHDVLAVPDGTPAGTAIRLMLNAHLDWLESHSMALRDLVRGSTGADPAVRAMFDEVRWDGVRPFLALVGGDTPDPATRSFVEGWITMKDDIILRWLDEPTVSRTSLVEFLVQIFADVLERAREVSGNTDLPQTADLRHSG